METPAQGPNWGEFGDVDQLGSLNYITPDCVQAASAEVHAGLSLCLSQPLNNPGEKAWVPHRYQPIGAASPPLM